MAELKKAKLKYKTVSTRENLSVSVKEQKIMRVADDDKLPEGVYVYIFHLGKVTRIPYFLAIRCISLISAYSLLSACNSAITNTRY